jgi:hypothetical protein
VNGVLQELRSTKGGGGVLNALVLRKAETELGVLFKEDHIGFGVFRRAGLNRGVLSLEGPKGEEVLGEMKEGGDIMEFERMEVMLDGVTVGIGREFELKEEEM